MCTAASTSHTCTYTAVLHTILTLTLTLTRGLILDTADFSFLYVNHTFGCLLFSIMCEILMKRFVFCCFTRGCMTTSISHRLWDIDVSSSPTAVSHSSWRWRDWRVTRTFAKFFMGVRDRREASSSSSRQEHLFMSPIVRQLMVTHNKLLIANLHFMPCRYTVSCKLPLCKVLELTAYAECWFEFLTIWYMISVVSVCLSVCMYVYVYMYIYVYMYVRR